MMMRAHRPEIAYPTPQVCLLGLVGLKDGQEVRSFLSSREAWRGG